MSWEQIGSTLEIVDYVLSCRAMGRQVEQLMVHLAVAGSLARELRHRGRAAVPTAKNRPCLAFWQAPDFAESDRTSSVDDRPPTIRSPLLSRWRAASTGRADGCGDLTGPHYRYVDLCTLDDRAELMRFIRDHWSANHVLGTARR